MSNCQSIFTFVKKFILNIFNKTKKDLAKFIGFKLINNDNFAVKYQLNKDTFPRSVKNFK